LQPGWQLNRLGRRRFAGDRLTAVLGSEHQGAAVDAEAFAALRGACAREQEPVGEDVAEVAAAGPAADLCAPDGG